MDRDLLIELLERFRPASQTQREQQHRMIEFLKADPSCFMRELLAGHFTGSAWVLDKTLHRAALVHHKKLERWLQPGGHADGESDLIAVARREACEELGLNTVKLLSEQIFDIDIHRIPRWKNVPEHWHYDVRFAFQAEGDQTLKPNNESTAVGWFLPEEIQTLETDSSVLRMCTRWCPEQDKPFLRDLA